MKTGEPAQRFLEGYVKVNLISVLLALIANRFTGFLGAATVFLISIHLLPFLIYYADLNRFKLVEIISMIFQKIDRKTGLEIG